MEEIDCYYYTEDEKRQKTIDRFKAAGWTQQGDRLCFSRSPKKPDFRPDLKVQDEDANPSILQRFQSFLKRTFKRTYEDKTN